MSEAQPAAYAAGTVRYDHTEADILALFELPFPRLLRLAQQVHALYWPDDEIQLCTLLSIKTGGCQEDCGYCPQSAHHTAQLDAHGLLDLDTIQKAAADAKAKGSTRFCMGAAWRSPPTRGPQFERVLTAVRTVKAMDLEVCTTLGMLDENQAQALADAGVHAYNHNLDTSPEYYNQVIHTRQYDDRLKTLKNVRKAGMTICCGGIVGMGEDRKDRAGLLAQLASLSPHPESVPVNLLVPVAGTPLAETPPLDIFELVRTIAVARLLMPKSRVRLSAGRSAMSAEAQALCFMAGANSIFTGEKLLTTPNPGDDQDQALMQRLGLHAAPGSPPVH